MSLEVYRGEEEGGLELMEDVKGKQVRSSSQTMFLLSSSFPSDGIQSYPLRKLFKNYSAF
jgi:hypothetical protein